MSHSKISNLGQIWAASLYNVTQGWASLGVRVRDRVRVSVNVRLGLRLGLMLG